MFRCQQCQQSAHRPTRVVVERKMVQHTMEQTQGPHGGYGSQIVRELNLCDVCSGKTAAAPLERAEVIVAPKAAPDFSNAEEDAA